MSFSVLDTRLGKKLYKIKENSPYYFYSPFVITSDISLNSNTVTQVLSCGLLCDISSSSITVTFPTATVLQSVINLDIGNYILFYVSAYSPTFPNANTLNIVGNTGVEVLGPVPATLTAQDTFVVTLVCASLNPLKFYIL